MYVTSDLAYGNEAIYRLSSMFIEGDNVLVDKELNICIQLFIDLTSQSSNVLLYI
jgi:hypothetical protein